MEAMTAMNWLTVMDYWSMSDLTEVRINLPFTLTQDGKSRLRMKSQSYKAWNIG